MQQGGGLGRHGDVAVVGQGAAVDHHRARPGRGRLRPEIAAPRRGPGAGSPAPRHRSPGRRSAALSGAQRAVKRHGVLADLQDHRSRRPLRPATMPSACSSVITLKAATPPPRWRRLRRVRPWRPVAWRSFGLTTAPTIRNHIHANPSSAMGGAGWRHSPVWTSARRRARPWSTTTMAPCSDRAVPPRRGIPARRYPDRRRGLAPQRLRRTERSGGSAPAYRCGRSVSPAWASPGCSPTRGSARWPPSSPGMTTVMVTRWPTSPRTSGPTTFGGIAGKPLRANSR